MSIRRRVGNSASSPNLDELVVLTEMSKRLKRLVVVGCFTNGFTPVEFESFGLENLEIELKYWLRLKSHLWSKISSFEKCCSILGKTGAGTGIEFLKRRE